MIEIDFKRPIECVDSAHKDSEYKYIGMIKLGGDQHEQNLSNPTFRYIIQASAYKESLFFVDIYGRIPNGTHWIRNKKETYWIEKDLVRKYGMPKVFLRDEVRDRYVKVEV